VIAYLDTSVLLRAFLPDEDGHEAARELISEGSIVLVTGTWTRIEVAAAITRAVRGRLGSAAPLLDAVLAALSDDGPVSVVSAAQEDIEAVAFRLASDHVLRAMDAWHVACALVVLPQLAEDGEERAFATRDEEQGAVARSEGLLTI
jgi:predicted nucleic acid-binding protein